VEPVSTAVAAKAAPGILAKWGPTIMKYGPSVVSGFNWLTGKNKPPTWKKSTFEQKYSNLLQSKAKHGLSPTERQGMMGDVGRATAQGSNIARGNIQGRAASQNMEGSGVVAEQMTDVDLSANIEMAKAARLIAQKNIAVKDSAAKELGGIGAAESRQKYLEAINAYDVKNQQSSTALAGMKELGTEILDSQKEGGFRKSIEESDWFKALSDKEKAEVMAMILKKN
jgi:hypothetical protein